MPAGPFPIDCRVDITTGRGAGLRDDIPIPPGRSMSLPQPVALQAAADGRGIVTKTTSRNACKRWLCDLMRGSPEGKPKPKDDYWQDAQKFWPGTLSERAFIKAWDDAVVELGVDNWSKGGRPRKPPQSKPPHQ